MKEIKIEKFLTQRKLSEALQQIVGDAWIGNEIKLPNSRHSWDMAFQINSIVTVVEYDGDEHYCNTIKIKTDRKKDNLAKELGYKIVRFPYWVQLDSVSLDYYFDLSAIIRQDFPHGFITTKIFPASFCELGIKRFEDELFSLPVMIKRAVIKSLKDRVEEYGIEYVLPSSLQYLVED